MRGTRVLLQDRHIRTYAWMAFPLGAPDGGKLGCADRGFVDSALADHCVNSHCVQHGVGSSGISRRCRLHVLPGACPQAPHKFQQKRAWMTMRHAFGATGWRQNGHAACCPTVDSNNTFPQSAVLSAAVASPASEA